MAEPAYRWIEPEPVEPDRVEALRRALSLPEPLARILVRRSVDDPRRARRFLRPDLSSLHPAGDLPDVDRAVRRLRRALQEEETVLVHGDYDVDGLSAAALLTRGLREMGGRAVPFVPHRLRDGYGLGEAGLERARSVGARVLLTADCGTRAIGAVDRATEAGLDVLVTDHHRPGERLPAAEAVVNPARDDGGYPFTELAGVGVAFKLLSRLHASAGLPAEELNRHLDLVALGTVADVVPLVDENRVLVRAGLAALERTRKPGLRSLLGRVGWTEGESLDASWIAYRLGPRLNSAGRMGSAEATLELLLTDDPSEGERLAGRLEEENERRRAADRRVAREAEARMEERYDPERDRALVLWGDGWPPGVVGIAASRVTERIHRPAALIAMDGSTGRGSARSVDGFPLHEALAECSDLLERFGGHEKAAGFEIRRSRLEAFDRRFRDLARQRLGEEVPEPELAIDLDVSLDRVDLRLQRWLAHLGPHGEGNPVPVLRSRDVRPEGIRRVGCDGAHLKLDLVSPSGAELEAIGFGLGGRAEELDPGERWEVAYELSRDRWRGQDRLQARIRDFRPAG